MIDISLAMLCILRYKKYGLHVWSIKDDASASSMKSRVVVKVANHHSMVSAPHAIPTVSSVAATGQVVRESLR